MLVESVATSLVIGKARKGKIKNIGNVDIKAWYLFILGFGLEFGSIFLKTREIQWMTQFLDNYFIYIHALSYALLFVGLILNFNKKSMILIFIGTLLNFIVIMANGGMMPVSGEGLEALGLLNQLDMLNSESILTHTLVNSNTKLVLLGDIIKTPSFYPLPKMLSIGDVFLAIGVFFFIQGAMIARSRTRGQSNMISFSYKSK